MEYRFQLKNSTDEFILDKRGYDYLTTNEYFQKVDIINNLRKHSSGCAVFQKSKKERGGKVKILTFYLHKIIAEKFLSAEKTAKKNLVSALNGNKLDCRVSNLIYRSRAHSSRLKKTSARSGYTGVYQEGKKYRVIISYEGQSVHVGMYASKEMAALAYNQASRTLYGDKGKINVIPNAEALPPSEFNEKAFLALIEKK